MLRVSEIRLLSYPFFSGIIMPILFGLIQFYQRQDIENFVLIIVIVPPVIHTLEFMYIFSARKEDGYHARGVIRSKEMLKFGISVAGLLTILFFILSMMVYNTILLDTEQYANDPEKLLLATFNLMLLVSVMFMATPLLLNLIEQKYNLGQALAHLKIAEVTKNKLQRIQHYHNAIEYYHKFLADNFGMRLSNENQILSWIMMQNELDVKSAMRDLIKELDGGDFLNPAKYLSVITGHNSKNTFVAIPSHENTDLWFRRIGSIAALIGIAVAIILHISSNPETIENFFTR